MAATLIRQKQGEFARRAADETELASFSGLANDAQELLGYKPMAVRAADEVKAHPLLQECDEMRQALAELDDPPFTTASVDQYKRREARRATPFSVRCWKFFEAMMVLSFLIAIAAAILGLIGWCAGWSIAPYFKWTFVASVVVMLGSAFLCDNGIILEGYSLNDSNRLPVPRWVAIPMDQYSRAIPDFAVQTAVDLKRRFPKMTFYVEELRQEQRHLDPFLRGDLPDDTRYYLEVWNEPNFRGKRMA